MSWTWIHGEISNTKRSSKIQRRRCGKVLARHERMQHQQEVEELKEKLANEVSARERDKEESMKQIEEIRKEFRSTLQQQIQLALQQVLTLEHSSPFFGSSIFANVPCLLGCTGYHRNHQHLIGSKWPKC